MKTASHLEKFLRLDATLKRLDPEVDQELWIWTAMNAGVHLLNAALHACGATAETDSFHTQVEGLYATPERATGELRDALHPPGDVMHVGQPRIDVALPPPVERAAAALRGIEDLRERFVRGSERATRDERRAWEDAYRACVRELDGIAGLTGDRR